MKITIAKCETMDRLDAMRLFVRVAELGSFAAAAQQLGVARSVVTRQIAALETHLRTKLMVRSTRSLALTPAGTAYLEKCRVILNLVEAVNTPGTGTPYESAVEGLVNIEDWMRMFAMNALCSYCDGFGNPNAKNTFLYQTQNTGWRLIPWDFDVGLGVFNDPVNDALFPSNVDPTVRRMYAWPAFVRGYWR